MQITVFGPNLSSKGQAKGEMHAHAADCADCAKYGPGKPFGGDDTGWTIEAESMAAVVEDVYADQLEENDYRADDCLDWVYFAPCVTLPAVQIQIVAAATMTPRAAAELEQAMAAADEKIDTFTGRKIAFEQAATTALRAGFTPQELVALIGEAQKAITEATAAELFGKS